MSNQMPTAGSPARTMVKLTPDLIHDAMQYFNANKERELNLRALKLPAIENLGVTNNQFDVLDFTDNDLKRLENFPLLPRLKSILASNNRIATIQSSIGTYLPNIDTMVLINNAVVELADLAPLKTLPKLEHLTLIGNPVFHKEHYRLFVIHTLPHVRVLDFRRIRLKERQEAAALFATSTDLLTGIMACATKQADDGDDDSVAPLPGKDADDLQRIKDAIEQATTLHEVEHLQSMLARGEVPGKKAKTVANADVEMEEEGDDAPQVIDQ